MNLYYFISKRIHSSGKNSFTSLVSRIATFSIAIGLAVIIVSFNILDGFQTTIRDKIFSFGSHIQITKYDVSNSFEESPLPSNAAIYQHPESIEGVKHIQVFSMKPGLLKTKDEVMGVVLKGVGPDFSQEVFAQNMLRGGFISFSDSSYSNEIMISERSSLKLRVDVGDTVLMYFVQNPPRFRKLIIKGIFSTGLEEFDDIMIIGDIKLNQRMNNWGDTLVGGYEIFVNDFNKLDTVARNVFEHMEYDMQLEKITDKYIQIFDWLTLLNRNVIIFLVLILFVACFNMISTLFIMIMERTNMIGILKALGATDNQIRKIFIYNGISIVVKGLIIGNLLGLGLCFLQYYFKIIPLDAENYYMHHVPIEWNWYMLIAINVLMMVLISLVLSIPVVIISKIKPINSIKFN